MNEREREREGEREASYKWFEHESPVAADNINRNKDHLRIKYQYLLSAQLIANGQ